MAWITTVKPTVRHPRERFQVRYRDHAGIERSGGIYPATSGPRLRRSGSNEASLPANRPGNARLASPQVRSRPHRPAPTSSPSATM